MQPVKSSASARSGWIPSVVYRFIFKQPSIISDESTSFFAGNIVSAKHVKFKSAIANCSSAIAFPLKNKKGQTHVALLTEIFFH